MALSRISVSVSTPPQAPYWQPDGITPSGLVGQCPGPEAGFPHTSEVGENGNSVNLRTRQYSKVPQKSGYQKKFALTGFSEGQLNPAPSVFLEKRVGLLEAASTPPHNGPKYVAYVTLYGASVSVAGRQVGQAPLI